MSQTISVSTTMGEQGFRDFAVFDAFHHRKAWLRPAVFAAIMLAFAASFRLVTIYCTTLWAGLARFACFSLA